MREKDSASDSFSNSIHPNVPQNNGVVGVINLLFL